MATTKTSTKAKTKTTRAKSATKKSPAKKTVGKRTTAAKATTAKSVSKSAAKDTAKTKAANNLAVRVPTPPAIERLRSLNMFAAGLFLLLAVAAGFLMEKISRQLTLGYITKDELTGGLASGVQAVADAEVRWLVVATLLLSAVMPILYVTRLKKRYEEYVTTTRLLPSRWVGYAITSAITVETVALLSGVSDLATLKLVGGAVVLLTLFAFISERQNYPVSNKPVMSAYWGIVLSGALVAAFLGFYAVSSIVYGEGLEWYVYALYLVAALRLGLMLRNGRKQMKGENYLSVERNFIVTDLVTKAAFAAVLIIAFRNF